MKACRGYHFTLAVKIQPLSAYSTLPLTLKRSPTWQTGHPFCCLLRAVILTLRSNLSSVLERRAAATQLLKMLSFQDRLVHVPVYRLHWQ